MNYLNGFVSAFKVETLRAKMLFTLMVLAIYRLGCHITVPGIHTGRLSEYFASNASNNMFGMYDAFTGGAFQNATIFALGIMPYISASIIIQLMGAVFPAIKQLQKEGAEGRAKVTQWTRYLTVGLAVVQAIGITTWLSSVKVTTAAGLNMSLLLEDFQFGAANFGFRAMAILTLTTGTVFIMWLGEQITQRGIGNGISLIIFTGIISTIPNAVAGELEMYVNGAKPYAMGVLVMGVVLAIVTFIVFMEQGIRRIRIESPRRAAGNGQAAGSENSYLPFKVNTAGVMPVIFASAVIFVPSLLAGMFGDVSFMQDFANLFVPGSWVYSVIFALVIIFFTYFYTAIQYNPNDIADNLKKSGGFVPGIRPGKKTAEYIDFILTRITLPGALFLAVISVGPLHLREMLHMSFYIGGTSVLIVVGVALDTLRQLESHLHSQNYEGFLKKGRIRGRTAS